ncbi:hypothetical protein JR316_0012016 [Psilocybe cubensis]|uniref:Uncharacterized protein n=1 Tax=Psilocybe cubensis TaxID=181762 RepID=A0ACB8GMK3_PSICU|nr:hypothetical protein JR316_0012016 [Psilocybe cubensis]KAH9476441.1 hypothetical protein JR316_0012016 [Psilocybe cubensis]
MSLPTRSAPAVFLSTNTRAIVIEYLINLCLSDVACSSAVLFMYCRHNEPRTVSQYLASLIAQMFKNYTGVSLIEKQVLKLYNVHKTQQSHPSKSQLVAILSTILLPFQNVRVVLDGLDELPDREQMDLVSILRGLTVSLFFTSRIMGFEVFGFPQDIIHMTIGDQNLGDIRLFLQKTIPQTTSVARILRRNEGFLEEICNKILNISGGMFLLAALRSQSLQGYTTMTSLSNSLDGLSDDIQSMYYSLMDRIDAQKGDYPSFVKRAMTWIVHAPRPLTIAELEHALAIQEGSHSFNERNIPAQDMLTHHPVGLLKSSQEVELWSFSLSYAAFDALVKSQDAPLLEYAYKNWPAHIGECNEESYPTETLHEFVLQTPNYPLLDSRIGFSWINPSHVIAYYGLRVPFFWDSCCNSRTVKKHTALTLAALKGHTTIVESLLACKDIDINAQTNSGDTALTLACKEGHKSVDSRGATALMHASHMGHVGAVHALLACSNIDVSATDMAGRTALLYSCLKDHTGTACALIRAPGIDVNSQDDNGHTALLLAATKNSFQVLKALLSIPGLNPNLRDRNGLTALFVAMLRGHNNIVKALLPMSHIKADVPSLQGVTALVRATVEGYVPIVDGLLSSQNKHWEHAEGVTPLMLASSAGHTEVVKHLLTVPGIDVDLGNQPRYTLTIPTGESNDNPIMDSFLTGMDLKQTCFDCSGITALNFAAYHGHIDVLKLLLAVPGINGNSQDCWGFTPLILASDMGFDVVARLLSVPEIRVNTQNGSISIEFILVSCSPTFTYFQVGFTVLCRFPDFNCETSPTRFGLHK